MSMDKSLICCDDSSKKTDPYGEMKIFAGSSGRDAGEGHLRVPGMRAGAVGDPCIQRGQRLRPRAGERARPRRLRRPGIGLSGQRQLRRAALLDRRIQARQRDASDGGHPVFLLRQGRQERRAAGLDPGSRVCRLHRGGRCRPGLDHGPAQPADPGLLQDPRRPPLCHAGARRLLPCQGNPRPGRGLAGCGFRQAGVSSSAR